MIVNKGSSSRVQELLGHRDQSTTERYLHLTVADLKETHRQYHAREQRGQQTQHTMNTCQNARKLR